MYDKWRRMTQRGLRLATPLRATKASILFAVASVMVLSGVALQGQVFAETSYSDDYSLTEAQFGSGSLLEGCSDEYCAQASTGDLAVGRQTSENYSSATGFNTTDVPTLEVITEISNQDLGVLDTGATATTTASVNVRTYLSNGYTLQITGNTPHMGTRYLVPLLGATESAPGTEQFGMNLVNNSTPDVGADPTQVPSGDVDTSMIQSGYGTPNQFKYLNGDVVAQSAVSTGETHYTLSMIINISNLTPGGYYSSTFSAVVTPVF